MNDKVTGLILKQDDYRENSVLIHVLTKEYGKIVFTAAGMRKYTSRNARSLMPYTETEFTYDHKENRTFFRLRSASPVRMHRHIYEDLNAGLAAGVLAEITDSMTYDDPDGRNSVFFYDLFANALNMLDEGKRTDIITAVFMASALNRAGMGPEVDGCVICEKTQVTALSAEEGGFLCQEHAAALSVPAYPVEALRQFRLLNKASLDQIGKLDGLIENAAEDTAVLVDLLRLHGGLEIRSFAFYQHLNAIE